MNAYEITESNGSVNWGTWYAYNVAQAIALLREDVMRNPDNYCGFPGLYLTVTKTH